MTGPGWVREAHAVDSLPLMVRPGTVVAVGARDDAPDYDYADGVLLRVVEPADGARLDVVVPRGGAHAEDAPARFIVERRGGAVHVVADGAPGEWAVAVVSEGCVWPVARAATGQRELTAVPAAPCSPAP